MMPDTTVTLRNLCLSDLPIFFEQQLDPDANYMAAFTAQDPTNEAAFRQHWQKIMSNEAVAIQTVVVRDDVAGYVVKHEAFGDPEVSYWIGKRFWGKGVATEALRQFLGKVGIRPIYARIAFDNIASQRVLEKCHFHILSNDKGFAAARNAEILEFIYQRTK